MFVYCLSSPGISLIHIRRIPEPPPPLQQKTIDWYHEILCHPGKTRTEETMLQHFDWKGLRTMVIATSRKCQLCKKAKVTNQKYASQMQLGVFGRDAILNVKHITGLTGNILDNGNKPESIKTTSARTNLDAFINTNDRNRLLRQRNDLDTIMISAAHAGKSKGVDPAHLSKEDLEDRSQDSRTDTQCGIQEQQEN